jgi:hypothetical protein
MIGTFFVLTGLSGFPWYNIRVRVSKEVWYTFSYSPFRLIIDMGETIDSNFFYRVDTTLIGIILFFILVLRVIKADSKKVKHLTPFFMALLIIFFIAFLPIHVTTASRLAIGNGSYAVLLGSVLFFISNFSKTIFSSINSLINKFIHSSILVKIYVFSNLVYFLLRYLIIARAR